MRNGFAQRIPVHPLRRIQRFQGGFHLFLSFVKILSLNSFYRFAKLRPRFRVGYHAQILSCFAADLRLIDTIAQRLFISADGLLQLTFFMRFYAPVERIRCRHAFRCGGSRPFRLLRSRQSLRLLRIQRHAGNSKQKQSNRSGSPADRPFGKDKPDQQKHKRHCKRIAETVDRLGRFDGFIFLRSKSADPLFQSRDPRIARRRTDIDTARASRKFAKLLFVQRTVHDRSGRISKRLHSASAVRDLDNGGLGGIPDPRNKQRDPARNDLIDRLSAVAFELIAIGHQHDGAVLSLRRLERLKRGGQSLLNIGSSDRNGVGIQLIKHLNETGFVRCQRTFEKTFPRERDQPEPVARIQFHQFFHQPFCMSQPRRLNIFCKHAFGNVENEQQIASLSAHLLNLHAPRRPCRRNDQKKHGAAEQDEPRRASSFGNKHIIGILRMLSEKSPQRPCGFPPGDQSYDKHCRKNPEQMPQQFRL